MKLSTEAAICIIDERYGDYVHTVTVRGSVWEPADNSEFGVHLDSVEDLPHWLELGDLNDLQQEACALALQYEYERRMRVQKRIPEQLTQLVANLRSTLEMVPTLQGQLAAHEQLGAFEFTVKQAMAQLEAIAREAA